MALFLPRWATDCLRRADAGFASDRPLALWERIKGAMRLAAVDRLAERDGLSVGQSLSDARAMSPGLQVVEIDRPWLTRVFADFADWHSYASPIVSVLTDNSAFGDLGLDITGVSHLFGGEAAMLESLTSRLTALGFAVHGAVAPSIGAAWALAHHDPGRIVEDDIEGALALLPVAALRLADDQTSGLVQMGLKRVGQLYGRPRKPLMARYGASLLLRLDQALDHIEERVTPRLPIPERMAERRFAEPIGYMDDVLMTSQDLAVRLANDLERDGLGAQAFHLFLYRVDHKVMQLTVNAARATRDSGHIARLFANHAERLVGEYDAGFGIDMIRLAASSLSPLGAVQTGAFDTTDASPELDRLYDRIASRLGPLSVVRTKFVDTHIPERAVRLEPVIARTMDDPRAAPDPLLNRPLRLLPSPEPITVVAEVPDGPPASMVWRRVRYRFLKSVGPERIEAEWWNAGQRLQLRPGQVEEDDYYSKKDKQRQAEVKPHVPNLETFVAEAVLRDYYIAEDEAGRRFWLFRRGLFGTADTPSWFMHGFFS